MSFQNIHILHYSKTHTIQELLKLTFRVNYLQLQNNILKMDDVALTKKFKFVNCNYGIQTLIFI